jgi:hypothetical protein
MDLTHIDKSILLRFFSRYTFRSLLDYGEDWRYSDAVTRFVDKATSKTNGQCISEVYAILRSQYQNEYFYKNILLNHFIPSSQIAFSTTAITELPIGKSIADFVAITDDAMVYEIKTDLDTFDRLKSQLQDYYMAFPKVSVIVSAQRYMEIAQKLERTPVGIAIVEEDGKIVTKKQPEEYWDRLSKSTIFRLLRKKERDEIILKQTGSLPDVSSFDYFRTCEVVFDTLPIGTIYHGLVQALKKRVRVDSAGYDATPYELKALAYFSGYKKKDYKDLHEFLESTLLWN